MKTIIISIIPLLVIGCSAKLLVPTQADVERVSTKYQSYTLTELNEGKQIFTENCKSCHGLKNPTSRNEEKWNKIVPIMVKRVNKKANSEKITNDKQEILLKYLITMSTAPKK